MVFSHVLSYPGHRPSGLSYRPMSMIYYVLLIYTLMGYEACLVHGPAYHLACFPVGVHLGEEPRHGFGAVLAAQVDRGKGLPLAAYPVLLKEHDPLGGLLVATRYVAEHVPSLEIERVCYELHH